MQANEKIRAFLAERIRNTEITDDEDIFEAGYVNSLFAMELVQFIESTFSVQIGSDDLELDNFRSITAMSQLIERKTAP